MVINIILVMIMAITGFLMFCYNGFIRANNKVKKNEAAIDVLLNQRFDLIPNLVEIVKGYSKYEAATFSKVTKLRSAYKDSNFSVDENNKIDDEFRKLFAVVENYPNLKANTNYLSLQSKLFEIEEKLNDARVDYNNAVTKFNNKVESIPSNFVANIFGFELKELFKIEEEKKKNIKVKI